MANRNIATVGRGVDFPEIDIGDIFRTLRRGIKTAIIIWFAIVIGSYAALMYMTEQYQADAKLLVKLGRENAEVPLSVEKGGIYATGVQKEEINSYINLLTSKSLIAETVDVVGVDQFHLRAAPPETLFGTIKYFAKSVVRGAKQLVRELTYALGLKTELTERQQAVKLVQQSLSVAREHDSNVISLSLKLPDGGLAETTLNTLIDLYLRRHVDLRRNVDVARVFEEQTAIYHEQLATLQARIAAVRADWNISSVAVQRVAMIERLQSLKSASNDRMREGKRLLSEEFAILDQLSTLPDKVVNSEVYAVNPSVLQIRARLGELEIRRVAVANNYEEDSEQVLRIDREVAELRLLIAAQDAELRKESTYGPHDRREKLLRDLADIRIKRAGLDAAIERDSQFIAELNAELASLSEGEALLMMMDLDWRVLEQKYLTNATRREEASVEEAMNMGRVANIAILSPPVVSSEPVSPNRMLLLVLSMVLGAFIALAATFLRERVNDFVFEESDVDRLGGLYPLGVVSVAWR